MLFEIAPLAEAHFEALYRVLDVVAREKRYLVFQQAPPQAEAFAFYRRIVAHGQVHFVAQVEGALVGWCDVLPAHGESRAHVGTLGIGLVPAARHRGIGAALMRAAIDRAWSQGLSRRSEAPLQVGSAGGSNSGLLCTAPQVLRSGLSRIELTVRDDNLNARALYERMGFLHEGLMRHAFRVDGAFHDMHTMALLR